ncbi:peptide chain release factor N(5)-glutamine methyltransferase [Peptostreptococcaceae bacterium OttesenSCG-928-C18]|nr:peptide chain release factor N(5)-glutamine methyltransferase [Peptostreptococcaceae bacterium OttesenSCG-928-C18]
MVVNDVLKLFGDVDGVIILKYYFKMDKLFVYLNKDRVLEKEDEKLILNIYERYKKDYPLQYILGKWNFYGRDFYVEEGVLIPRFETEILVEKILELDSKIDDILEIGIGTGIISLTLALEKPNSRIIGVDISKLAIELATKNKEKYKVENCKFIESNVYSNVDSNDKFDLIVSNPPYINKDDMDKLDRKLDYEPVNALYGGEDGLDFYREIIKESVNYLKKDSYIALEIGYNQGKDIKKILETNKFKEIQVIKDYNDFDRCVIARR